MDPPRVAIIIYTMYGHIGKMAEAIKEGITSAGGSATILQVPETLSEDVLTKMKAHDTKPNYPVLEEVEDLCGFDAFLFGIPTRYGNMPAQWKALWDKTGQLWVAGGLAGKYAGIFFSTSTLGGGQETTALNTMSTVVHHGMTYVPLGYAHSFGLMSDVNVARGGSAWGAGTITGPLNDRQPSDVELKIAKIQGATFWRTVSRVDFTKEIGEKKEEK